MKSRVVTSLVSAVICTLLASSVHAADAQWIAEKLPRTFTGELKWNHDRPGPTSLTIDTVAVNGGEILIRGGGDFLGPREATFHGRIDADTLEIMLCGDEVDTSYLLAGCFEGEISEDLQKIKARVFDRGSKALLIVNAK